jgi:hypothetical protein
MGRRKGSLNKKTLERMGLDKYKIDRKKCGKNDQNNRKKCDNEKPKRVRRTKAELIEAGYYDKDKTKPTVKAKEVKTETKGKNKDADRSHLFKQGGKTIEQVSTQAIQKAQERGDTNWEQDFRNDYEQGQKIYYVEINELCHTKELLELYVGTVYSKVMICWVDRGESHSIGMDDADKIFREEKEARKYYSKVRVK